MKKILIINRTQYGYNTDSYKFTQYLKDKLDITYVCLDKGKKRIDSSGINIVYIKVSGGFLRRGLSFLYGCNLLIRKNDYDVIFLMYFTLSSILAIVNPKKTFILDIRTGSVSEKKYKNVLQNHKLVLESKFFQNITIISESLREKLELNSAHILPLGSDKLSDEIKDYSELKLLYIGTFINRNIDDTIQGVHLFLKKYPKCNLHYDIIGYGRESEVTRVKSAIIRYSLLDRVFYHGEKTHDDAKHFFDKCNIGVSYIPITSYFNCQPPTKTFEYVNAGLVCIATQTDENKKLINHTNGVLCKDTPESFCFALETIFKRKDEYNYEKIAGSLSENTWQNISIRNLYPYLISVIEKSNE